jgi:hypothetical protein
MAVVDHGAVVSTSPTDTSAATSTDTSTDTSPEAAT